MAGCDKAWSISRPRIFDVLSKANNILIAGCGGGYDIFSGLPLYFSLRDQGKTVSLANLSFTGMTAMSGTISLDMMCEGCYIVDNTTTLPSDYKGVYFPEYYLARWLAEETKEDIKIYSFERDQGAKQLSQTYAKLATDLNIDAIVLVDGGTDSLTFGSECEMGTPTEDHLSMISCCSCDRVKTKLLLCLGFGVDSFHGISHGLYLENVAKMEKEGGYYGCFSVSKESTEGQLFAKAYENVKVKMLPSIVCSSITDAMAGEFGNYHSNPRTKSSTLFINPLMNIYWAFDLEKVVKQIPYRNEMLKTKTMMEVSRLIYKHQDQVRKTGKTRQAIPLPM